jgi:hypothetical protein
MYTPKLGEYVIFQPWYGGFETGYVERINPKTFTIRRGQWEKSPRTEAQWVPGGKYIAKAYQIYPGTQENFFKIRQIRELQDKISVLGNEIRRSE